MMDLFPPSSIYLKQIKTPEWFIKSRMQWGSPFEKIKPKLKGKDYRCMERVLFIYFFCLSRLYETFCHDIYLTWFFIASWQFSFLITMQLAEAYRILQRKTFSWWILSPPQICLPFFSFYRSPFLIWNKFLSFSFLVSFTEKNLNEKRVVVYQSVPSWKDEMSAIYLEYSTVAFETLQLGNALLKIWVKQIYICGGVGGNERKFYNLLTHEI